MLFGRCRLPVAPTRSIDQGLDIGEFGQRRLDAGPHIRPVQPPDYRFQREESRSTEFCVANDPNEIDQARVDVLYPARVSPVALGWKVDDEARVVEAVAVIDEHSAGLNCPASQARA